MSKIAIVNDKFTCPLLGKEISERGEIMYATCAKCEFNALHQFVDENVYCNFGSSSSSSSGSSSGSNIDDTSLQNLELRLSNLETTVAQNIADDADQQEQIDNATSTLTIIENNVDWETFK